MNIQKHKIICENKRIDVSTFKDKNLSDDLARKYILIFIATT